jgi:hypothetical protein
MNKRPLAPKFLNKLDNYLLLNRPDTWSTRFHLALWYTLLFMIALTAICFVMPTDHRQKSIIGLWSGSAGVLALIGFIVWLVYLFRFNVFKQFGTVFPGDRLKTFLLYFFTITMMILVVFIPPVVESIRADNAYSSNELASDMNKINEIVTKLEYKDIPDEWKPDTLVLVNRGNYPMNRGSYQEGLEYLDSSEFRWRVAAEDSIRSISRGVVISYDFFDLAFVKENRVNTNAAVHVENVKDLYYSAYKHPGINKDAARLELQRLIDKYSNGVNDDYYYNSNNYEDYRTSLRGKYHLYSVESGIDRISDRKYRLYKLDYSDYIRAVYYFALVLSLLVFIFRHSTVKTYFLALLVGVVLSILSGLFVAVLHLREGGIYGLMIFYFISFGIISMLIFSAKRRSIISGIALNAFVLLTPFIPIICVALYYYSIRADYYEYYAYDVEYHARKAFHFLVAEFAGGIILLILIETLFKRLYRAWYASPED